MLLLDVLVFLLLIFPSKNTDGGHIWGGLLIEFLSPYQHECKSSDDDFKVFAFHSARIRNFILLTFVSK